MSKLFCNSCPRTMDEPHHWDEDGVVMSGCFCGNGLLHVEPCPICGEYPTDEYDEKGNLENEICKSCFNEGIAENFMEYLWTLDKEEQAEFYCGKVEGGRAYDAAEVLEIIKKKYGEYLDGPFFEADREHEIWKTFINDGDPGYFADWLIEGKKRR